MRIFNSSSNKVSFTDFDRGNVGESRGIYESWLAKADNSVPANGFIDILDTDEVMLSAEFGQIKKYKSAGVIDTRYSIVGTEVELFSVTAGVNDTFKFTIAGSGPQTVTLPAGKITAADVVSAIDSSVTASGFSAEVVYFYRSSNQDDVVPVLVDGDLGKGYGQRTEGILDGFICLVSKTKITIGSGNANALLGFKEKDYTKAV